jgi:hypothetical protein
MEVTLETIGMKMQICAYVRVVFISRVAGVE